MQAIIMAGGVGSRLRPLTCEIPKPMAPILGKPVVQYSLELLKRHGITGCTMTLQYLPEKIIRAFGDGRRLGLPISYALEKQPMGTAGSVKNAMEQVDGTFVVMSGDALTDVDLTDAIRFHREKKAMATLVLKRVENPVEYGIVVTDSAGRVVRFQEKPTWGEVFTDTANTGIYILEPEVMKLLPADSPCDFSGDLFPKMLEMSADMYGYLTEGYWCDVGSMEQYLQAQIDAMEGRVRLELPCAGDGHGRYISPAARIAPNAQIGSPCYIGAGAVVEDYAVLGEGVVLGEDAVVSQGASLKRAVLGHSAFVGRNCQLRGCVLCDGAQMKTLSSCFEGSVLGEGAIVQEMATVSGGAGIWPHKVIERHGVVKENVVWGRCTAQTLFADGVLRGRINQDMTAEFLSHLAASFAGLFPGVPHVAVACFGDARGMAPSAVASGLEAAGALWVDGGRMPVYMLRYLIDRLGLAGGIHIYVERGEVTLQLLGEGGKELSEQRERQIERMLSRGEWPKAHPDRLGSRADGKGGALFYHSDLLRELPSRPGPRRLGIFSENEEVARQVASVLEPMGIFTQIFPFIHRRERAVKSFASRKAMLEGRLEVGIQLDARGDAFAIVDSQGETVSPAALRHILEEPGDEADPVRTLCRVLQAMDRWEDPEKMWADARDWERGHAQGEVYCPNARRGAVLRELSRMGGEMRRGEGMVLRDERGTVTVRPDGHAPLFRVASESASSEMAEELTGWCLEKIRLLTEQ